MSLLSSSDEKPKFDRTWIFDKVIELTIFVLGFFIALWIDGMRGDREVKQLHNHYLEILQLDLEKDKNDYEFAYRHDSLRAEGCDYLLTWLLKRQTSNQQTLAEVRYDSQGHIGPGFDFEEGWQFFAGDTIQIVGEDSGWYLDTTGYWINRRIVEKLDNDFTWFSAEVNDSVVNKMTFYEHYIDETKSVFQHRTGYDGMITQNTASFLETTEIESKLSAYYSFGSYLSWLEDYYRDSHFWQYSALRHSFGKTEIRRFLYLLDNEQNNELIRHLSLASMQSRKEMRYYREALALNAEVAALLPTSKK